MPATKRSRKSGSKNPTKRGKNLKKPKIDNTGTNDKDFPVEEEENVEQMTQVPKRPEAKQTSDRWTPYFKSKRLHSLSHGEAIQSAAADGDEEAREETAAMQECQSIRRALIEVIGPNNKPLNLGKLPAEFDTGADDCLLTQSCYQRLKDRLKFQHGELDIAGATGGQVTLRKYVELNFSIGSIHFPPGVKFWVDETLPEDAGFGVLLSGPFLAHHNVIYLDPKVQREIEKDGMFELKIQKHFDFPSINRRLSNQEKMRRSHFL